jgi:zinc protease
MSKKFQLKNGLKVLFVESNKSPVVSVQMWVKTGSADERKGEEGISHFIEHLLFKGTRKYGVGQIASTVEGAGGELNAYTSFDQTVFYITISKHFSDTALDAIVEMMGFPLFDEQEINNEREVVIEEIKRGQDDPHRRSSQLLFSTSYKKHPYGTPVIGFEKVIRSISRKKIIDYYQSRYVPKNMTLLVVGDFQHNEMKKKVERLFGELQPFKLRKVKRTKELVQKLPRIKIEKVSFEETLLTLAWKTPPISHKDTPALEVLALILGQGDSSRLTKRLRLDRPLVNYIGASNFSPIDPGFFAVSLSTTRENLEVALNGIREELHVILSQPPEEEEIKKAVVNLASEEFYALETVDGMARKFGSYEHLFGDYRYFSEFIKSVYSLTSADILRVARKYIQPKTLSMILTTSRGEKTAEEILKKWAKSFSIPSKIQAGSKRAQKSAPKLKWKMAGIKDSGENIPQRHRLNGGIFIVRTAHDTPVVNLRCAFRGGLRLESPNKCGLTELLARTWATTTESLSESEMYKTMESMAAGLSSFGGRNTAGINLTAMSAFWSKSLDIFGKVLLEPSFSEEVIEREKIVILEQLKNRNDNPAQVAIHDFMANMFGKHPYGRDPLGEESSIKSITREDLVSHYKKMASRKNFTAVASGHLDEDKLKESLTAFLEKLPEGEIKGETFEFKKPSVPIRSYLQSDKEQTHIVVGYPGITFTDKRRYTLQVLQSILAGQGGRLFLELRDKASLAYSVAPLRMEGIDAGYFGAYIGCSPEKGAKAIEMMQTEFDKLCDQLVPEAEIVRARSYLIGRHDIDLQKNSAITAAILFDEVYGLDYREAFRYAEKLEVVTAKDIRELAQTLFSQPSVITAIGRDRPW